MAVGDNCDEENAAKDSDPTRAKKRIHFPKDLIKIAKRHLRKPTYTMQPHANTTELERLYPGGDDYMLESEFCRKVALRSARKLERQVESILQDEEMESAGEDL